MSEKPSALSTIPPQPPAEGEYDLICTTMAESARGRWFLDEHARRNRNTDTLVVLAAIERIEAMIRGEREQQAYQSFRHDLLDMAKAITQTRAEVAAIKPEAPAPMTGSDVPQTPANRDIFAAAERLQDVAWTMRERGLDPRICRQIEVLASAILAASSLRNPDDHRAQKLGEVLNYLERRINGMLDACTEPAQALQEQALQEQALQEQALQEHAPQEQALEEQAPREQALAEEPAPTDDDAIDQVSTEQISTDLASTYQALPDEEVEAASAPLHGGNGHDAGGSHAVIVPDREEPTTPMAEPLMPVAAIPPPESPAPISADAPEPDMSVEPAPLVSEEATAPPAAEIVATPVAPAPQHDPAPAPPVRAAIPQIDIEPLVVVPMAWRKMPAEEAPAELEHAPIHVEPLFPERHTEAAAVDRAPISSPHVEATASVAADPVQPAEATAKPLFRPPEAAVVFLVEYPTPATEDARTEPTTVTSASMLEASPLPAMTHLPERLAPVAAPEASVERLAIMIADIDKEPLVPAPADTAAPAPQPQASAPQTLPPQALPPQALPPQALPPQALPPQALPPQASAPYTLPPAEPIPQPPAAPPPAATAFTAPSDPLAALRAMSPEERIALFT